MFLKVVFLKALNPGVLVVNILLQYPNIMLLDIVLTVERN